MLDMLSWININTKTIANSRAVRVDSSYFFSHQMTNNVTLPVNTNNTQAAKLLTPNNGDNKTPLCL